MKQTKHLEKRIAPEEFQWARNSGSSIGTSLSADVETTVLKGNPAEPGLYTILLRIAPNTRIHPHSHQDDRIATVVSGTWYFAYGDEFDEAALKPLPPGSFYTEPPEVNHFGLTREEVIIQMTGIGPSSTSYVDPRNDPTRQQRTGRD